MRACKRDIEDWLRWQRMRAPVAAQIFQNDATGAFNQAPILNISLTRTHIDTNKTCIDSVEKKMSFAF